MQPFDKHPASPAALRQTASELRELAAEAIELAAATRQAYQPAIGNWHGMAAPEMAAAGESVLQGAKQARQAQLWAAVATEYWATRVEAFDAQVDAVTAGLASQAASDYGATGTDNAPPTAGQIADARGAATAAAKQLWMQAYDTYIDTGRHEVAAMLRQGPTEQHLLTLREAGVLPDASGSSPGKPADDDPGWFSTIGHGILDVAGLVPAAGEAFDGINALWYLTEGDKLNAGLSAAAMVPIGGWFATGGKLSIKGAKAAKGADEVGAHSPVAPQGGLRKHDDAGGHTLDPDKAHVGASDQQLLDRLSATGNKGSSSYYDRAAAEQVASENIAGNADEIRH